MHSIKIQKLWGSLTIVAATALTSGGFAAELDSASFAHQYNGDVYPVPSYTEGGSLVWTVAPSTDGDLLTYQCSIAESGYWRSADTEWTTAGALNSSGWTIELRVHILNDAAEGTERSLMLFGQDGGGSTQGRMGRVWIGQNSVSVARTGAGTQLLLDSSDNTAGFHVFRLAQQPASSVTYLWRDGVYLAGYTPTFTTSSTTAAMYVGDAGGSIGGPTVQIDYVRWDSGFWEPAAVQPAVVQSPQNTTNAVGANVTFKALFTNAVTAVQWHKDGNPISGATSYSNVSTGQLSTFNIPSLAPSDEGGYYCQGTNTAGFTNTQPAYLHVLTDVTPPTIVSNSVSAWAGRVRLQFSEVMDPTSTGNPLNYVFQNGALTVGSVTILDSLRADVFLTSRPVPGSNYVLLVSNVKDTSNNSILPNTPVAFVVGTNFPARTNLLMAFNEASAQTNAFGGHDWLDLSGNENHAVNPSTALNVRPLLTENVLNGHGVFHFSHTTAAQSVHVPGATGTGLVENNYTWFAVTRCINIGNGGTGSTTPIVPSVLYCYTTIEPAEWHCYYYRGDDPRTTNGVGEIETAVVFAGRTDPAGDEVAAFAHPANLNTWHLLSGHVDNTGGSFGRVLDPVANTSATATNSTTPLGLGQGDPQGIWFGTTSNALYRFGGDMAEILIYTGDLSQSDYDNVENYLRAKYFPPPPTISIGLSGSNLEVQFTGVLQSSTNAVGPYTDVPSNPTSPYVITPPNQLLQQYFRSRSGP